MAAASLVRDKEGNLKQAAFRKNGRFMEYEFAFPYRNQGSGDSLWELGKAYQIAILVGPTQDFKGISEDTWMSDQIYLRLGSASKESIYNPPLLRAQQNSSADHTHGAENGQKGNKK